MVPLVIPLVPMVPLVKTDGSQYYRQSTVWAKLPTLERVTGRFAPKPVPPGTIRSKTIFRTGRFTPGRFASFVKIEIKVFLRNENRF